MRSFAGFAGLVNQISGESADLEPFISGKTLQRLTLDLDAALDLYVAASIKEVPPCPRGQCPDRVVGAGGGRPAWPGPARAGRARPTDRISG